MNSKHLFTNSEKQEFLKILKKYGPVIQNKATDRNSSRRKTIAWNRIACEYNTSTIAPYPASSKQLRRLWMNLKQRNKLSIEKLDQEIANSEESFPNEDMLDVPDAEEELTTPFYVNVGDESSNQGDSLKIESNAETNHFTATDTDKEGRGFSVEFLEEVDDDVKPDPKPNSENEGNRIKNNLQVREYQDRRRRLDELHLLHKRLLLEQIRQARAKASLAELELRQRQYNVP